MRIVVTGGGTGGHVFPALEVARLALESGDEVAYYGSLRGQEGPACRDAHVEFRGFKSVPIPRLHTPSGFRAALQILRSAKAVRIALSEKPPDVVFATGGYAAGPVLTAARALKLPIVLHEQNAVPGRTNKMMANHAAAVCVVFDEAGQHFPNKVVRTGMPVRDVILSRAEETKADLGRLLTLCYGGSQGSLPINEAVLTMAMRLGREDLEWLQITGPRLFEQAAKALERIPAPPGFNIKAFLGADEMAEAYSRASLAVSRSGAGAATELALFGIPAVYIPYPYAAADHQYHNAKAIEKFGGASVVRQKDLSPERLESEWKRWAEDRDLRARARAALQDWAIPDAARRVLNVIRDATAV